MQRKLTKSESARLGGLATAGISTEAKAKTARMNGRKGGRPLKPTADPKRRERYLAKKLSKSD